MHHQLRIVLTMTSYRPKTAVSSRALLSLPHGLAKALIARRMGLGQLSRPAAHFATGLYRPRAV